MNIITIDFDQLEAETLAALADGVDPDDELAVVSDHTDECGECDSHGLCDAGLVILRLVEAFGSVRAVHAVADVQAPWMIQAA